VSKSLQEHETNSQVMTYESIHMFRGKISR